MSFLITAALGMVESYSRWQSSEDEKTVKSSRRAGSSFLTPQQKYKKFDELIEGKAIFERRSVGFLSWEDGLIGKCLCLKATGLEKNPEAQENLESTLAKVNHCRMVLLSILKNPKNEITLEESSKEEKIAYLESLMPKLNKYLNC